MTVYLCGPILGRSDAECVDWRLRAAELLAPIETLDPIRRDYRGKEHLHGLPEKIVADDLEDIRNSRALLVMFDQPSIGTSMEIRVAAAEVHIPVYTVDVSGKPRSPWLVHHTTQFFDTLEDACAALQELLG